MNNFIKDFFVLRVDSIKFMIEEILSGPWRQAKTLNFSTISTLDFEELSPSFRGTFIELTRAGL